MVGHLPSIIFLVLEGLSQSEVLFRPIIILLGLSPDRLQVPQVAPGHTL